MKIVRFFSAIILLSAATGSVCAQSTDAEFPTPVRKTEISGAIPVRDLGDPRLTKYFYTFNGTAGDLIVSVESKNLDGDIDIFASPGLRPLAKITMYSGEDSTRASKTIYLRKQEALVLRIEARSPNDNPGSYRVRFDGSFAAIAGDDASPESAEASSSGEGNSKAGAKRVSSVGATIPDKQGEPVPSAERKPEISTLPTVAEGPNAIDLPAERKRRSARSASSRSAGVLTSAPPPPTPASNAAAKKDVGAPEEEKPVAVSRPAGEAGPRLIIELRDGMRLERYMTTVRKITVENGQIVVSGANGKVERHPLADVLRMAIEP